MIHRNERQANDYVDVKITNKVWIYFDFDPIVIPRCIFDVFISHVFSLLVCTFEISISLRLSRVQYAKFHFCVKFIYDLQSKQKLSVTQSNLEIRDSHGMDDLYTV